MSFDRDRLEERLDVEAVRERLDGRVDVANVRERVVRALDPSALRAGLDALYARYFMPPSVTDAVDAEATTTAAGDAAIDDVTTHDAATDDADFEPFDFGAWLREGCETGPTKPPAEARVVTDAVETAGTVDAAYEAFDFAGWLAAGEEFEPVDLVEAGAALAAAEAAEANTVEAEVADPSDGASLPPPSFGVHPAKAATYALFLAVVAMTALSAGGYLPPLGPAVGLGG